MGFDLAAAVVYAAVFLIAAFRAGMFQWFWGSVLLWLGCGMIGAQLLPGIWGITHLGPLFFPHLYITAASLFFFVDHWKRRPEPQLWQADCSHIWLGLFAVSNAVMTLAFLILAAAVWYHYPGGVSTFAAVSLFNLYALKPSNWFVMQAVIMMVFYLHRKAVAKQEACLFSAKQLQAGLFLALVFQMVTVVTMMLEGHY